MLRSTGLTVLPMLALLLAGCQTLGLTPTIATGSKPLACVIWQPITYSGKSDTPETIRQVRVNNAKRGAYCNG